MYGFPVFALSGPEKLILRHHRAAAEAWRRELSRGVDFTSEEAIRQHALALTGNKAVADEAAMRFEEDRQMVSNGSQ